MEKEGWVACIQPQEAPEVSLQVVFVVKMELRVPSSHLEVSLLSNSSPSDSWHTLLNVQEAFLFNSLCLSVACSSGYKSLALSSTNKACKMWFLEELSFFFLNSFLLWGRRDGSWVICLLSTRLESDPQNSCQTAAVHPRTHCFGEAETAKPWGFHMHVHTYIHTCTHTQASNIQIICKCLK